MTASATPWTDRVAEAVSAVPGYTNHIAVYGIVVSFFLADQLAAEDIPRAPAAWVTEYATANLSLPDDAVLVRFRSSVVGTYVAPPHLTEQQATLYRQLRADGMNPADAGDAAHLLIGDAA